MYPTNDVETASCFRCTAYDKKGGYETTNRVFCKKHEDHDGAHGKLKPRNEDEDDSDDDAYLEENVKASSEESEED